jgi:hypothetical protein
MIRHNEQVDDRGFVIEPDHKAGQRFINEREKLRLLMVQGDKLLAEYDRVIGSPGYPVANKAFDREYSAARVLATASGCVTSYTRSV